MNPINIMIVDDSVVMRSLLEKIISQDSAIKIVATAGNGQEAIDSIKNNLTIDVVLLDLQMPVMDGLHAIPYLLEVKPKLKIIIVSSLSAPGAKCTIEALALGAADYIEKPTNKVVLKQFSDDLLSKIHTFGMAIRGIYPETDVIVQNIKEETPYLKTKPSSFKPEIFAIASSTGGPRALLEILGGLSDDFLNTNIILITQHIKNDFVDLLVNNINSISKLNCKKAVDHEELQNGTIYLAPSDSHLEIQKIKGKLIVNLSDAPPENFCRPSADPMFNSLAKLPEKAIAIILTGIGSDGLNGAKSMAEKGDIIIAQDQETSVVWGMPGSVANAGICSAILPLHRIAAYIEKSFK